MRVNFDLARLPDSGFQQFLYLLVETESERSPFSDAIFGALSREEQRRLSGGDPVRLALPLIEEAKARAIVSHLLAAKTSIQAAARKAVEKSQEDLAVGVEFINALIVALRGVSGTSTGLVPPTSDLRFC
jgi:hypothetical protein